MRCKKLVALLLAGCMTVGMTGCGSNGSQKKGDGKIVVWTLSEDLKTFANQYMKENEGKTVETVVIPPEDYPTKLTAALRGKATTPDVIVGEPQMIPNFMEAGFFEDLNQEPYNAEKYKDKLVDYVWDAGKDADGKLRALSYQITPGGIFYRRDIAKEVWGTDDPEQVAQKFKDFATIEASATEVRDKGYRIFSDTGNLRWFANNEAWVQNGKVVISQDKKDYMDTAIDMYKKKLVAFAPEWSAAWFASMAGEIPMNAEWQELKDVDKNAEKTQVLAYALPSWASLTIRDSAKDNVGKYGVCAGPCSYFGGGTFVGISSYSDNKSAAWDFVKYVTLNEKTSKWWAETSNGDVVSMKSVLEEYKDKENVAYGNQKTYQFFYDEAKKIDYSTVTKYDDQLKTFYGSAIESIQKGEKTKKQAMEEFKKNVNSVYPELKVKED